MCCIKKSKIKTERLLLDETLKQRTPTQLTIFSSLSIDSNIYSSLDKPFASRESTFETEILTFGEREGHKLANNNFITYLPYPVDYTVCAPIQGVSLLTPSC